MLYLMNVIDHEAGSGTDDETAAITRFNSRLRSDGHWVMAAGLAAPSEAVTVDHRHGADRITPGPFVASDDFVSGFWIVEAETREVALRLAREGSLSCNRRVELRPFHP